MTNCKQLKLPPLEGVNIHKLIHFFKLGNHLFTDRYLEAPHWKSFDLIKNTGYSPMFKHFPAIEKWLEVVKRQNKIGTIKTLYLSILSPKNQIPWHVDKSDTETFSPSFITSIKTDNSFIEFKEDKKYTYKEGMSYIIKSGVEHRIFNLNDEHRITLCVTPEVNDHVLKLVA